MAKVRVSRRHLLGAVAASVPALALAACGATLASAATKPPAAEVTPTTAAAAPTAAPAGPVNLQYFYATGGSPKHREFMTTFYARHTETHPGITVELMVPPDGMTATQLLETMVAGGTPPDILYTGATVTLAARGVFLDIFPLLEKSGKTLDDWHPNARKIYTIKGGSYLWGLPNQLSTLFLAVNTSLFDQAGVKAPSSDWADPDWTWGAYLAAAQSITKREGDDVSVWGCFPFGGSMYHTGPNVFGGRRYDEKTNLVTCDEEKASKGFQYDHDTIYVEKVAPTPAQSQALEGGFLTGKVALNLDGPWSIATYTTILARPEAATKARAA